MKNNPYLSVAAEVEHSDADLTSDASKTNEEDDYIDISEKENQKNVGYQETLKIDVKNIDKTIKTIRRQIYEVIDITFF